MSCAVATLERDVVSKASAGIKSAEFRRIQDMMHRHVGIVLADNKRSLVESRVRKRLKALEIGGFGDYLEYLASDESGHEMALLIDAISTNVTHFFRESDHFKFLSEQTGRWLAQGRRTLRFWSAAASTGEEPYSMAMTLAAIPGAEHADLRILATDIATNVLRTAGEGVYEKAAVDRIPAPLRERWFGHGHDGVDSYRISDELKRLVVFKRLNLNKMPYGIKGRFDVIFCRNVMIYFDRDLRDRIVAETHRLPNPGGYLIVGHAETLIGMETEFEFVRPSVYRRT